MADLAKRDGRRFGYLNSAPNIIEGENPIANVDKGGRGVVFALVVVHDVTTAKMPGRRFGPASRLTTSKRQNAISSSMSPLRLLRGSGSFFFSAGGEIGFTTTVSCI
jgi:hypothetical protein